MKQSKPTKTKKANKGTPKQKPSKKRAKKQPIPTNMPKGKSADAVKKRRAMIVDSLTPLYINQIKTRNKDKGWDVSVTSKSIAETAHHASRDNVSTMAACNIRNQIKKAKYVAERKLKGNRREKDLKLKAKHEFKGKQDLADTKLILGETKKGEKVLYSVTKKRTYKRK